MSAGVPVSAGGGGVDHRPDVLSAISFEFLSSHRRGDDAGTYRIESAPHPSSEAFHARERLAACEHRHSGSDAAARRREVLLLGRKVSDQVTGDARDYYSGPRRMR